MKVFGQRRKKNQNRKTFCQRRRKRTKIEWGEIFGEGKYLVFGGEEEQRGKRRKIYEGEKYLHRKGNGQSRKRRKIFGI